MYMEKAPTVETQHFKAKRNSSGIHRLSVMKKLIKGFLEDMSNDFRDITSV